MATLCKRLLSAHPHCKRLRSFVKHEAPLVKAEAEKQDG